jgi:hypothetical protein
MSNEVGAEVSAWDGYITGSNLELVPHERIVQAWRTTEFADEHDDSIVTVTLEPVEEGTLLTLVHSNVPNEHRSYEEGGWESQYFEPMKSYFARLEQEEAADESEPQESAPAHANGEAVTAAPRRARKAEAEQAQPPVKAAGTAKRKAKRAAGTRAKRQTARTGTKRAGTKRAAPRGAAKRAAKKQAAGRKAAARKAAPKKAGARKATAKKAAAKKATSRKTVARKAVAKKAGAKSKSSRRRRARR